MVRSTNYEVLYYPVFSTFLFLASSIFLNTSQTLSSCVPPLTIQQERAFKMHIKIKQCTGCQMSFIRVPNVCSVIGNYIYALLDGNFKKLVPFILEQCSHQFW